LPAGRVNAHGHADTSSIGSITGSDRGSVLSATESYEIRLSFPVSVTSSPKPVQGSDPTAPSVRDGNDRDPVALTLHGVRMPLVTEPPITDTGARQHRR
jgi:hypothetical protein